jgi:GNAT superfamily N-acetyltransferase
VAYLRVGGDEAGVRQLQAAAMQPPLHHELLWPYVPHVTVVDGVDPARIEAAVEVLGSYRRDVRVDAVHLLEEQGRQWRPIAAFPLGPPAVIGRGGQPLELDTVAAGDAVTITARRDGAVAGRAEAWRRGSVAWLALLDVDEGLRREGVGSHLLAAVQSWAAGAGAEMIEAAPGLELDEFLASRGWSTATARPGRRL